MVLSQRSHSFVLQKNTFFPVDLIESELHMFHIRLFQVCWDLHIIALYVQIGRCPLDKVPQLPPVVLSAYY